MLKVEIAIAAWENGSRGNWLLCLSGAVLLALIHV